MRSYWITAVPDPMCGILVGRGKIGHRYAEEHGHVKTDAQIGVMLPQTKEHQRLLRTTKAKGSKEGLLEGEWLTPWFQTSGLLNCKRINFCFNLPTLWDFGTGTSGNEYTMGQIKQMPSSNRRQGVINKIANTGRNKIIIADS